VYLAYIIGDSKILTFFKIQPTFSAPRRKSNFFISDFYQKLWVVKCVFVNRLSRVWVKKGGHTAGTGTGMGMGTGKSAGMGTGTGTRTRIKAWLKWENNVKKSLF
jgi:hypothetical protein